MFILRKISGQGVQMNFALGKSYTLITKERNPKEFEKLAFPKGKSSCIETCIYGFVSEEHGKLHQLSDKQKSYIMTGDGKTFANVSQYIA